jgi:hypothetical protein
VFAGDRRVSPDYASRFSVEAGVWCRPPRWSAFESARTGRAVESEQQPLVSWELVSDGSGGDEGRAGDLLVGDVAIPLGGAAVPRSPTIAGWLISRSICPRKRWPKRSARRMMRSTWPVTSTRLRAPRLGPSVTGHRVTRPARERPCGMLSVPNASFATFVSTHLRGQDGSTVMADQHRQRPHHRRHHDQGRVEATPAPSPPPGRSPACPRSQASMW